ncbi:signal transduction protein [Veronia nyctiphanis]|uniref:Signal transduction protein n=1 Tax=Veronia nyctiphanis TaxID=1278244 RepID=A0A4Q0YFY4_9GAMM|nr:EAL domain-containing protein [Veronia nyctiphanis]RXJ69480.1 signal transduction protein [Veronia nyctiphanis]
MKSANSSNLAAMTTIWNIDNSLSGIGECVAADNKKQNHAEIRQAFFAKQSIVDLAGNAIGFELLYRDTLSQASFSNPRDVDVTASLLDMVYNESGREHLLPKDKLLFVNFDYDSIVNLTPLDFPRESLVIEVLETCAVDKKLELSLQCLKEQGYKIAFDDFSFSSEWIDILYLADIVKVDFRTLTRCEIRYLLEKHLVKKNLSLLAEKVETESDIVFAKQLGFDLLQGYAIEKPDFKHYTEAEVKL